MNKRGRKPGAIKTERKDIRLTSITLFFNRPLPLQLREFRIFLNISVKELATRIGCHPTNVDIFENPKNINRKGSSRFLFQYIKALGVKEVKFKL